MTAGGFGTVTVTGTGGAALGGFDYGVLNSGTITSGGGNVSVRGGGSFINGFGIELEDGSITTATNGGTITLSTNNMDFNMGSITAGSGSVTLQQNSISGIFINIGGADDAPPRSALTNAELDLVTAGTLNIGNSTSDDMTITAPITRTALTNINLTSGGAINFTGTGNTLTTDGGNVFLAPGSTGVSVSNSGVDIDMDPPTTGGTLSFADGSILNIALNGTTADTEYDQFHIDGTVNLTGVNLNLIGTLTPMVGQTFTIVNNDAGGAIMGNFEGLDGRRNHPQCAQLHPLGESHLCRRHHPQRSDSLDCQWQPRERHRCQRQRHEHADHCHGNRRHPRRRLPRHELHV